MAVFLQLLRVGSGALGVLCAGKGLDLSTDGRGHKLVAYLGFYGGAAVAVVAVIALTIIIERRKERAPSPPAEPAPTTPATPPPQREPQAPGERQFVEITPAELVGFFEGHTSPQGAKLVEPYIGKWIEVSGPLSDVLTGRTDTAQVTFQKKSIFDPDVEHFDTYMYFDRGRWDDRLAVLRPGSEITVQGRIDRVNRVEVHLDNCELVDKQDRV